jgi:hypothetical protein
MRLPDHDVALRGPRREDSLVPAGQALAQLPWTASLLLCLTVGLAPFRPPHIVTKLRMLFQGRLVRPIDWFDLALHASPWLLLLAKSGLAAAHLVAET